MKGEALKGHLDLILLSALEAGPTYGYSLASMVAHATAGNVKLSDGTIYTALHRLENAGLLTSRSVMSHGRVRRIYSLTERGRRESERMRREWHDFARGIETLFRMRENGVAETSQERQETLRSRNTRD